MPRLAAYEVLEDVLGHKHPLDTTLERQERLNTLTDRNRAFARTLVMTVLRRRGQIDALISGSLERRLPKKARGVQNILRLGIAQVLFLSTATHAAVNETVDMTADLGFTAHKKLVNAVLRKMSRDGQKLIESQDVHRLNTPLWLWESWTAAYGEDICRRIAEAHAEEAPLDIAAVKDPETWAQRLEAEILDTGSLRRPAGGRITDLPGFDEGAWWIQDAAAALPATLLGNVKGKTVIDLCAAPGGKSAQLAAMGANVIAVDRSENRLKRLRSNLARLNLEVETVAADAATWRPKELADAVLLDAPCSATGTLRRHPDVAWLKSPEEIVKLAAVQSRLAEAAMNMVKPGGLLVYCTCSIQPEEGVEIYVELNQSGVLSPLPITPEERPDLAPFLTREGTLRTLPCHMAEIGGMDGFFAARWKRL
jgi:16S rRNA (cytosine967-C5)-methyltransferase